MYTAEIKKVKVNYSLFTRSKLVLMPVSPQRNRCWLDIDIE